MSSSEAASLRGFARAMAITLAAAALAYAAMVITVDPMGAGRGNGWCPAGMKTSITLDAKSLVARRTAPATIMLGTSRVDNGFATATLARLGPAPRANLATADALPAEMAALARDALAGGNLRVAYVGVDFNSAVSPRDPGEVKAMADAPIPALEAARRTWFGADVFAAQQQVPPDCTVMLNPDGTATAARLQGRPRPGAAPAHVDKVRREYGNRAREWRHIGTARADARLAELRGMVRDLRKGGVAVVLFIAPHHSQLDAIQREVGLLPLVDHWHGALARMARQEGAAFVDLRGKAALARIGAPPCPQGGADCHFRDLTHYSGALGDALAGPLAQAGQTAP